MFAVSPAYISFLRAWLFWEVNHLAIQVKSLAGPSLAASLHSLSRLLGIWEEFGKKNLSLKQHVLATISKSWV